MGDGRSNEAQMEQAIDPQVGDEGASPFEQIRVFDSYDSGSQQRSRHRRDGRRARPGSLAPGQCRLHILEPEILRSAVGFHATWARWAAGSPDPDDSKGEAGRRHVVQERESTPGLVVDVV